MSDVKDGGGGGGGGGETAKAGLDALVKSIVGSIETTGATEAAIHTQIQTTLGATTKAVEDLVKTNAYSPELAQENLKMQKAVIDSTITAIENLNAGANGKDKT